MSEQNKNDFTIVLNALINKIQRLEDKIIEELSKTYKEQENDKALNKMIELKKNGITIYNNLSQQIKNSDVSLSNLLRSIPNNINQKSIDLSKIIIEQIQIAKPKNPILLYALLITSFGFVTTFLILISNKIEYATELQRSDFKYKYTVQKFKRSQNTFFKKLDSITAILSASELVEKIKETEGK